MSDSDSEYSDSDYTDSEVSSCSYPNEPCRPTPQPLRRIVNIEQPSSQKPYNFTVMYNEKIPTGSRIEIQPEQHRMPFKPQRPRDIPDREQGTDMYGDPFSTHFRREMQGIDPSARGNAYNTELGRTTPSAYPFHSEENFNTNFRILGGAGLVPHFGSRVKQGLGDVSQQRLEWMTGKKGFKQPKREVENSSARNRQGPKVTFAHDQELAYAQASLKDKKPFELPFQQGRDTGDRTMPFGTEPIQPPLRILNPSMLRQSQPLPSRIQNIPSQAQPNPNGMWSQGMAPPSEFREPMFDYSDSTFAPAPEPTKAFNPPLMQAPIRVDPTNRSDTHFEWWGPVGNTSASARMVDPNFSNDGRVAIEDNPYAGPAGNSSTSAGGYLATVPFVPETQRDGNEWVFQPGPAVGPGQTPMRRVDQMRETTKQTLVEQVTLPRIVRNDIGAGPMHYSDQFRETTKQTLESAVVQAPMQNTGPGAPIMRHSDEMRPTIKQTLAELIPQPQFQLSQGGAGIMPRLDQMRETTKQTTVESVVQGRMQNTGPSAPIMHRSDQMRETTKQQFSEATIQGPIQNTGPSAPIMHHFDEMRETTRQGTEQSVVTGNVGGNATGKAPIRHYDDEMRDTRRQFTAENPETGAPFNSSAAAGGYLSTDAYAPLTERNRGMEESYSFGPVEAGTKAPTDRGYLQNMTFDDRKEVGLYTRVPGRSRNADVPRNLYGNYNLPPDDQLDSTRTANPNMSRESTGRVMPTYRYSDSRDQLHQEFRYIDPMLQSQRYKNPYATDVRVIAGQPQY